MHASFAALFSPFVFVITNSNIHTEQHYYARFVVTLLGKYIEIGNQIQSDLTDMWSSKVWIKLNAEQVLTNKQWKRVARALGKIDIHLNEYIKNGEKAMVTIEGACRQFIDQY